MSGNKFNKKSVNSYEENYKTIPKNLKEVINKWRFVLCFWIAKILQCKISVSPINIPYVNLYIHGNPNLSPNGLFLNARKIAINFISQNKDAKVGFKEECWEETCY